jgi:hypothetical protein
MGQGTVAGDVKDIVQGDGELQQPGDDAQHLINGDVAAGALGVVGERVC